MFGRGRVGGRATALLVGDTTPKAGVAPMRQSHARMDGRERRVRAGLAAIGCALVAALAGAAPAAARVLHVGRYNRSTGSYNTNQHAVNPANPADWILIGPCRYKAAGTT